MLKHRLDFCWRRGSLPRWSCQGGLGLVGFQSHLTPDECLQRNLAYTASNNPRRAAAANELHKQSYILHEMRISAKRRGNDGWVWSVPLGKGNEDVLSLKAMGFPTGLMRFRYGPLGWLDQGESIIIVTCTSGEQQGQESWRRGRMGGQDPSETDGCENRRLLSLDRWCFIITHISLAFPRNGDMSLAWQVAADLAIRAAWISGLLR